MPKSVAQPRPGDLAPHFRAQDHDENWVTLSALRGRQVLIYFFPEVDTPGCTTQACGVRDVFDDLGDLVVLGVAPDSTRSHASFRRNFGLPFTLLSDEGHQVARAYGVSRRRRPFGFRCVERTSFLIGTDGVVQQVWRNVDPSKHAGLVKDWLAGSRVSS